MTAKTDKTDIKPGAWDLLATFLDRDYFNRYTYEAKVKNTVTEEYRTLKCMNRQELERELNKLGLTHEG